MIVGLERRRIGSVLLGCHLATMWSLEQSQKRRVGLELEKDLVLVTAFEPLDQATAIIGIPPKFSCKSTNSPFLLKPHRHVFCDFFPKLS